nr:MAG TPA: hypothetical protein [Caudoviricetes sp.]
MRQLFFYTYIMLHICDNRYIMISGGGNNEYW